MLKFRHEKLYLILYEILNIVQIMYTFLGMYYLRTKAAAAAIQFTVDKKKLKDITNKENETPSNAGDVLQSPLKDKENVAAMVCSLQNKDDCLMCGS